MRGALGAGLLVAAVAALPACATGPANEADWDFSPYQAPRFAYSPSFGGVYHVVERGQTLWRIAQAYGVDLDRIQWVNDIEDVTRVAAGRKLFIPGVQKVVSVAPYRPGEEPAPVEALPGKLGWPLLPRQVTGGEFTSFFGARPAAGVKGASRHQGVDLPAMEGTPVDAAGDGVVVFAGQGMSGYGNAIVIKHNQDWSTVYAHNAINLVKEGQAVEQGQVIAEVGRTGRATGPHLHFELRKRGVPQDPVPVLPLWNGGGTRAAKATREGSDAEPSPNARGAGPIVGEKRAEVAGSDRAP